MRSDQGIFSGHIVDTTSTPGRTGRLTISVGGIGCSIVAQSSSLLDLLRSRYQWFESSTPAIYEVLLRVVPQSDFTFNEGEEHRPTLVKVSAGDNYLFRQAYNPFVAVISMASRKALVKMGDSEHSFDNFLRIFYSLILVREKGLLLRGASLSDKGRGQIFFGPPGSGKTTVARLSPGRTVLTDELALIKPHNGGYYVYGTPFGEEFTAGRSNTRAELTGLYSLNKAETNSVVPLDQGRAVTALCRCVLSFGSEISPPNRVLDTCRALVDAIPVYELNFRQDPTFWELIDQQS